MRQGNYNHSADSGMPAHVAREWRATLDGMRDPVCLLAADGRIRRCNRAMRDLLHRPFRAIIGQKCWPLLYHAPRAPAGCGIRIRADAERRRPTTRFVRRRWYNVSTDLIHDEANRVVGAVHVMADITDLKHAEARLQQYGIRLDTLHRIDRAILEVRDPVLIATDALRRLSLLLPCLAASVILFDAHSMQARVFAAVSGRRQRRAGQQVSIDTQWIAALRRGRTCAVPGIEFLLTRTQRIRHAAVAPFASLALPLLVHGELVGSLNLVWRCQTPLQPGQLEAAREVSRSLAVSLHNSKLFKAVSEQRQQLRVYAARMTMAEEHERRRISRELHDRVGQNLTAVSINLDFVRHLLPASGPPQAIDKLDDAVTQLGEISGWIRDVMCELRPDVLDDYGLIAALNWYGQQFTARCSIPVTVVEIRPLPRLTGKQDTALFRIVQEALANVAKHAHASSVRIEADTRESATYLTVTDNGVGFDATAASKPGRRSGWGLMTMRERAEGVGASVRVESRPGTGTRIVICIPRRRQTGHRNGTPGRSQAFAAPAGKGRLRP